MYFADNFPPVISLLRLACLEQKLSILKQDIFTSLNWDISQEESFQDTVTEIKHLKQEPVNPVYFENLALALVSLFDTVKSQIKLRNSSLSELVIARLNRDLEGLLACLPKDEFEKIAHYFI